MTLKADIWNTCHPAEPGFLRAWRERLARASHANFSMSAEYLRWQAEHGEPARAVLLEEDGRRGAMVLREAGGGLVCGFPWRWQMVIEDADPAAPEGMTAADAAWFYDGARRLAGNHRLRFYAPHRDGVIRGYLAGHTTLLDLAHGTEDELIARMEHGKRRRARKCIREGHEVVDDASVERQRVFARMVDANHVRRHHANPVPIAEAPGPGEDWRTWEQPWHWLLTVVREGVVVAGLGMGRQPGGMVDTRTSGSTPSGLQRGANVLVLFEAIRGARLAGHTWMNFGGSTTFKREFGGTIVPIYCRLGGGVQWLAPNLVERCGVGGRALLVRARRLLQPRHS